MKQITTILLAGSAAIFMTACGGGSSTDVGIIPPPTDTTPTPTTINPNGLWSGTQVVDGITADAQYIIYNNEISGYTFEGGALFAGSGTMTGDQMSANYNIYDWDTGAATGSGDTSGTVIEQTSIVGSFSNSFGQNGTLNLSFDNQYNNPSSLSYVAYDYTTTGGDFTINSSGAISGTVEGCSVAGIVTIPDPAVNIYDVSYTLSDCVASGDYSGLGTIVYYPDNAAYVLQAGMSNDNGMALLISEVPKPSTF